MLEYSRPIGTDKSRRAFVVSKKVKVLFNFYGWSVLLAEGFLVRLNLTPKSSHLVNLPKSISFETSSLALHSLRFKPRALISYFSA